LKGNIRGLISEITSAFAWKDSGTQRKISVKTTAVQAENRDEYLWNISPESYLWTTTFGDF
jgi:hypothetical protein